MKKLIILVLICLTLHSAYSQALEGQWFGSFSGRYDYTPTTYTVTIELHFIFKDTAYDIYSYSDIRDDQGRWYRVKCKVYFKQLTNDSIYLEEIAFLSQPPTMNLCFQKFFLKITKTRKDTVLEGKWINDDNMCQPSSGRIYLRRHNKSGKQKAGT